MSDEQTEPSIEDIELELEQQAAEYEAARKAQLKVDLAAFRDARVKHGVGSVKRVDVLSWVPGIPTFAVVKNPGPVAVKRYRDMTRASEDNTHPDHIAAAEALADVSLVYPDKDLYRKMCELRGGIRVAMGVAASNLEAGKAAAERKG